MQPPNILFSPEVEKLLELIEEATRATEKGVKRFVEPAHGTLKRAKSKYHHIIFGRRGSGKSSLLHKAASELTTARTPIAFVDLEKYKGHSYPDVLLSVLLESLCEFKQWLETAAIIPASNKSFWSKISGLLPSKSGLQRKLAQQIAQLIQERINELKTLLHSADEMPTTSIVSAETTNSKNHNIKSTFGDSHLAKAAASITEDREQKHGSEIKTEFIHKKIEFLQRNITEYQKIIREMSNLAKSDCYLFLDDLYHIRKSDQARVIDYFHRVAKSNALWLKIGTIKHRTEWYIHANPPIGMKLSDDAEEINLDLTLEKYSTARNFLLKILEGFLSECGNLKIDMILTGGGVDRLVLACGGVARDFLVILRKAIYIARERNDLDKNPRIFAEDVNQAAGEHEPSKKEEFKLDTLDDKIKLEQEFEQIKTFCLDQANANIFLIKKDLGGGKSNLIQQLVDLRMLHLVRSRVTVSGKKGEIFEAYLLDVSQYTGARKKRELENIEFWREASKERLRRSTLIYA